MSQKCYIVRKDAFRYKKIYRQRRISDDSEEIKSRPKRTPDPDMAKAFWSTETNLNDSKILKTIRAPKSVTVKPKPEDIPSFGEFLEFVLSTDLLGTGFSSHWVPYWRACTPCHFKYSGVDHKI